MTNKWICIEENNYLILHHYKTSGYYPHKIFVGDILDVEEEDKCITFVSPINNETYLGNYGSNMSENYFGDIFNEKALKEYFMPYDKWLALNREKQMKMILDE